MLSSIMLVCVLVLCKWSRGVIGLLHTLKRTSVYRGRVIVQITNKKVPTYECRLHSAVEIQLAIL